MLIAVIPIVLVLLTLRFIVGGTKRKGKEGTGKDQQACTQGCLQHLYAR